MSYYEVPDQAVGTATDTITVAAIGDVVTLNTAPDIAAAVGTQLLIASQSNRPNWFAGVSEAYDPATGALVLTVSEIGSGASIADDSGPWLVFSWTAPAPGLPFDSLSGMHASISGVELTVTKGDVRSSDDTTDIVFADDVTKDLTDDAFLAPLVQLAGTFDLTSGTVNLVGTGTSWLTDLKPGSVVTWPDALPRWHMAEIATVTDDTHATVTAANAASGNASANTLYRGFSRSWWDPAAVGNFLFGTPTVDLVAIRADATGAGTFTLTTFDGAGNYDLPAGYSKVRAIGTVTVTFIDTYVDLSAWKIAQSLAGAALVNYDNTASGLVSQDVQAAIDELAESHLRPKAILRAIVTPTLLSGNISSVDTSTDIITWSTGLGALGIVDGSPIIPAVGGTWPTGATTRGLLNLHLLSDTTFTLHKTYADAIAGANRIDLTAAGSGTRTAHTLVLSGVIKAGFASASPIGGSGTYETTMGFALNFSPALNDAYAIVDVRLRGMTPGVTGSSANLTQPTPSAIDTAHAVFRGANGDIPIWQNTGSVQFFSPTTWATQSTTPFTIEAKVWD